MGDDGIAPSERQQVKPVKFIIDVRISDAPKAKTIVLAAGKNGHQDARLKHLLLSAAKELLDEVVTVHITPIDDDGNPIGV